MSRSRDLPQGRRKGGNGDFAPSMLIVVGSESRERKPVIIERSDLVEHAFDGLDAIGIHQGARCDGRDEANYPTSSKRHDATKPDKPARLAVFRRRIVKR